MNNLRFNTIHIYLSIYLNTYAHVCKAKWTPIKSFCQPYNINLLLKTVVKPWKFSATEASARTSRRRWLQRPSVMKTASRCHWGNRGSTVTAVTDCQLPGIFGWVVLIGIQRTDYPEIHWNPIRPVTGSICPFNHQRIGQKLLLSLLSFLDTPSTPHPLAHLLVHRQRTALTCESHQLLTAWYG